MVSRLRIAWVEEWASVLGKEMLPYLALHHDVTYVTAGDVLPKADFVRVIRGKPWPYMNLAGFELSRRVNRLYRDRLIDLALVWASIGFGLGEVPFINLEGTSVYAEIGLFASRMPWPRRVRFLPGLVHYALPEMICNRRAARVIVPSHALRSDLLRLHNLEPERVRVVPHGVEKNHMALYERKPSRQKPQLLFVGRLHFRKGIVPVLTEFSRRRDIPAEFFIAGDGPDRAQVEGIAATDPRIKVLGPVSREALEELLVRTNIFVFPTFYEGFGLALTEAMASGHACVCYDIPVVREVLADAGVLVPLGDAQALVEEISQLVADPQAIVDYSARAHKKAGEFSWTDAREEIHQITRETSAECSSGRAKAGARP